jgi:hypothetical protein
LHHDLQAATRIAEDYVDQLSTDSGVYVTLFKEQTIEREFGWAFFYGPGDPSIMVAGNAPFIVDRRDGSIHMTGTAYPIEQYLESYARVGRSYPFAVPEHIVVLDGWKPGILKVSLTKLIRSASSKNLGAAKHCTDELLAGRVVTLSFPSVVDADSFCAEARDLGALAKRETRFQ